MYSMHKRSLRSLQNTCKTSKFPGSKPPDPPITIHIMGPTFVFALDSPQSSQQHCYRYPLFWSQTTLANRVIFLILESAHSIFIASDNYYLFLKFHNTENLESTVYQWELLSGTYLYPSNLHNMHKISMNLQCMNSKTKHETSKWKFGQ